jgi:hypothetical protein
MKNGVSIGREVVFRTFHVFNTRIFNTRIFNPRTLLGKRDREYPVAHECRWRFRMPTRLTLTSVSCTILFAVAIPSTRASAQSFFVTPIPNAPFSGVVNIERTMVRKDGSVMQFKSTRKVARDTRGRIHNEFSMLIPVSSTDTPEVLHIHLYDPQTRISTEIDIRKRTFWTETMNHPPSTEPPSIRFAAPDGNAPASEFTKQEDLGIREIEGVPAHGIRQTQTVTDENDGKQVVITDEYWYSQDLRINLMIKHNDPRKGMTTMTVAQVTRTEPDPAFFEVPEGYTHAGAQSATEKAN